MSRQRFPELDSVAIQGTRDALPTIFLIRCRNGALVAIKILFNADSRRGREAQGCAEVTRNGTQAAFLSPMAKITPLSLPALLRRMRKR